MDHHISAGHDHHQHSCCGGAGGHSLATVNDPVCGMSVDPAESPHRHAHGDEEFHFCSARCREKFAADPDAYLGDKPAALPAAAEGAIWTCPMHPEVQQVGPGSCPICGMALEPMEPSQDEGPNPELVDFTRRLTLSAILAVPLLVVSMGAEMLGLHLMSARASAWVQLALTAPIVL